MAICCASSGDRGRPLSRPLRGAEPTDLGSRGARDGAEREGARCRTFLVQIIPQRVGRTADSPKPPINPRTETGARHLNLTGAAAAQISLATAEKRRCDRGKTFCLARRVRVSVPALRDLETPLGGSGRILARMPFHNWSRRESG